MMGNACQVLREITANPTDLRSTRLDALQEVELARHLLNCQICLDEINRFLDKPNVSDDTIGRRVLFGIGRKAMQMDPKKRIGEKAASLVKPFLGAGSCCDIFALVISSPSHFLATAHDLTTEQKAELLGHPACCSICQRLVYGVTNGNPIVCGASSNTPSQNALLEFLMHSLTS